MTLRYLVLAIVLSLGVSVPSAHLHAVAEMQAVKDGVDGSAQQAGDAARGKLVFERRCTGCHALDENREGPQLRTVYGRKAGSVAGFEYSEPLVHSGLTWNPATLDQWLTDPDAMVPGNNMSFATPKAADRRDIIAFLQQAAGKQAVRDQRSWLTCVGSYPNVGVSRWVGVTDATAKAARSVGIARRDCQP